MSILTLQPDPTAGIDTYVVENTPTIGNGATTAINMRNLAGSRRFAFMKFDVSSIPAGSTINSATLSLWTLASVGTTFVLNNVLVANSGWVEGATWDYANPSTVRWAGDTGANGGVDAGGSVSGIDFSASQLGTFTNVSGEAANTQYDITLSPAEVTAWLNANYGFVIQATVGNTGVNTMRSSDYTTDATKRPKLVIDYTLASDQAARTIKIGGQFGMMILPSGGAGMIVI